MSNIQIAENSAPLQSLPKYHYSPPSHNRENWTQAAMNLFTAMVVADSKVLPAEINEMEKAVKECFPELGQRSRLEMHLRDHADHIHKVLRGPGRRYWLGTQYMALRDYPDHMLLLEKLWNISVCDGKLHEREGQLIDFFAHFWRRF